MEQREGELAEIKKKLLLEKQKQMQMQKANHGRINSGSN